MCQGSSRVQSIGRVFVACWLWGTACGGEAVSGGRGGVALRDLPRRVAELQCRKMFECCTPAQLATAGSSFLVSFTDEASCRTTFQSLFEGSTPRQEAGIAAGHVIYNSVEVDACLALIDALTCEELTSVSPPECKAWTPLQQDGEECDSDSECISHWCDFAAEPVSQKTCARASQLGEACTGACVEGTVCDSATAICTPAKRLGEACLLNQDCESTRCDSNSNVCVRDSICPT